MKHILTFLLTFHCLAAFSQFHIYSGFIGTYPIQLAIHRYSDGVVQAIYAYDRFDTPIIINGQIGHSDLILNEENALGEVTATLKFPALQAEKGKLTGQWISKTSQKKLKIQLTQELEFDYYDEATFTELELIQPYSTSAHYFKLILAKEASEAPQVRGVRIYEKKTDRLIQELELECQLWGLENTYVDDFNFDGIEDFAVFEASYAGPNTSYIYLLRDPESEHYFVSEITGTSLEFDQEKQLIYGHNQCCAGRYIEKVVYKLVDNKMVLVSQTCLEYDEETQEYLEEDCE